MPGISRLPLPTHCHSAKEVIGAASMAAPDNIVAMFIDENDQLVLLHADEGGGMTAGMILWYLERAKKMLIDDEDYSIRRGPNAS